MNFNNAVFEMSAGLARQLPESTFPEVVFSGKGSLTASCAARTSEASAKGICELEGIAPDTHRQTLWVRCTSGTVCLDYIDIKLSKA